jgi:hypothetical protein
MRATIGRHFALLASALEHRPQSAPLVPRPLSSFRVVPEEAGHHKYEYVREPAIQPAQRAGRPQPRASAAGRSPGLNSAGPLGRAHADLLSTLWDCFVHKSSFWFRPKGK